MVRQWFVLVILLGTLLAVLASTSNGKTRPFESDWFGNSIEERESPNSLESGLRDNHPDLDRVLQTLIKKFRNHPGQPGVKERFAFLRPVRGQEADGVQAVQKRTDAICRSRGPMAPWKKLYCGDRK